ncbi:ATP-binding protein [Candidatus Poribacteria bacterium]|nr:ATP-binding protein [Candidatus Poribacteria bacterium]
MAEKPTEETGEPCPHCGGYGLIAAPDGTVSKCECGQWDGLQAGLGLRRARIPRRFAGKNLATFKGSSRTKAGEARRIAESYASSFSATEEKGLLLRGGTGTGKTHLAVGILAEVIRRGYSGIYYNFTDLLAQFRDSYRSTTEPGELDMLEEMDAADLLVLDDLGAEMLSDWVRDRLYLIINRRYEIARPMIITTNCDDYELRERLGPRVVSRLYEMCATLDKFPEEDYRYAHMR